MGVLYWVIEDRKTQDGRSLMEETPLNWALLIGEERRDKSHSSN